MFIHFIDQNTAYMKKLFTVSYFIFLISYSLFSQNVGIGTSAPNASALLDVTATNKGVLVPRVNNAQMLAIASPANGLFVYNTDSACFAYRNATTWVFLKGNATASNDWSTKGNAGTDTSKNFIGTTDNVDLIFKRNKVRAGFLGESGGNTSFGVGALNPGTTSGSNSAFGYQALYSNINGPENTATGNKAMYSNIDGRYNTANGFGALFLNVSGWLNTALGYRALLNNKSYNNTAVGSDAMFENVSGYSNVAVGIEALRNSTNRSNLVAIGDSALYNNGSGASLMTDATANTAVGSKALFSNTTGFNNSANGSQALYSNTTGFSNTANGSQALYNNTSGYTNTASGNMALYSNTIGEANTANGFEALYHNTAGYSNTANGNQSLYNNTNGNRNTAIGYYSLYSNTTGSFNTAIGDLVLSLNISGSKNTAIGRAALSYNTTGENNTVAGVDAMYSNISGHSNTVIGVDALRRNTDRSNLVAVGDSALFNNGIDAADANDATGNTAVGSKALFANTAGYQNTAVGFESLKNNTYGQQNTAVGFSALLNNLGSSNTAFGYKALYGNISGGRNTAIGENALAANNDQDNVAIGSEALTNNINGSENTAVGRWAGRLNTGTGNVFLGHQAGRFETGSYKLYIEDGYNDGDVPPLVYGEFNNQLFRINGRTEILSADVSTPGLRVIKSYESGSSNVPAVYGENIVDADWGIGVEGRGGRTGVEGHVTATGALTYVGVKGISDGNSTGYNLGLWGQAFGSEVSNRAVVGEATGGTGEKYGVYGYSSGAGTNYAVYGEATGGTQNYAGYFKGEVVADGKITITTPAGATGINLSRSDAYAEMRVIRNTLNATDKDLYLGFGSPAGSAVHLYSDGSETMLAKGNLVGVGKIPLTSNNDSRLQIKQIGAQNGIGVEASNSTNHWDFFTTFDVASNFALYYNGVLKGTFNNATGAYVANSDRRMKKDITPYQPVLNKVLQLQAYQYHYIDNKPTDNFSNGFMAQDVQKLFPDAVVENTTKDGETRLGINYQYFTVLAIKGLQEQQQQIRLQEERIAKLEVLLNKLLEKKQ